MSGVSNKSQLVIFLQKYVGRTLTKVDIAYSTSAVGELQQSCATLVCLDGREFPGEPCGTVKEAEQSAAGAALQEFAGEIAAMPPSEPKSRTWKKEPKAPAADPAEMDPKSALVQALQAHCGRPLAKPDIIYTLTKHEGQYQATITLVCVQGPEFNGEVCSSDKMAEMSAAAQALSDQASWGAPQPAPLAEMEAAWKRKAMEALVRDEPLNAKSQLVIFLQAKVGRTLTKQDIVYKTLMVGPPPNSPFQAMVTLVCAGCQQFTGQPMASGKEAEKSAAQEALNAYWQEVEGMPPPKKKMRDITGVAQNGMGAIQSWQGQAKGIKLMPPQGLQGKGMGQMLLAKGMGKAWPAGAVSNSQMGFPSFAKGGKAMGAVSGPLPRETVQQGVTGEVVTWNPKGFGWLRPHTAIEHPLAATMRGDGAMYVHKQDVTGGQALAAGAYVQFNVYADARGLGASEVLVF